jgi:hypothetical protein
MSYAPGTVEYYKNQLAQSRLSNPDTVAHDQAKQKVAYEAYQEATKNTQQEARTSGQLQTVTQQHIQNKQQQILDNKYLVSVEPDKQVIGPDGSGYSV